MLFWYIEIPCERWKIFIRRILKERRNLIWAVFANFFKFAGKSSIIEFLDVWVVLNILILRICLICTTFLKCNSPSMQKLNQDHSLSPLLSQNSCSTNPYCKFSPFPWYYSDFIGFLLVFCFYFESLCLYDFGHFNFIQFFWAFPSKIN